MKENNWKIEINTTNKEYPFIVIDNWYNKEEEESKWIQCLHSLIS
jgi:hypothetical protein